MLMVKDLSMAEPVTNADTTRHGAVTNCRLSGRKAEEAEVLKNHETKMGHGITIRIKMKMRLLPPKQPATWK